MPATYAFKLPLSEEEYLAGEGNSEVQHEYLNGLVRAVANPTKRHNLLVGAFRRLLDQAGRRKGCRTYAEKVSVRVEVPTGVYYYYPDVMVHCGPDNADPRYTDDASVIVEILSESTEHTDRAEKFFMYQQLPSFQEYVLVGQDEPRIVVLRKSTGWQPETYARAEQSFAFESVDCTVRVGEIYGL